MSKNKIMIRFHIGILISIIIFLLLGNTYIDSFQGGMWCSILIGILTGVIVMFGSEVKTYLECKRYVENALYRNAVYVYILLIVYRESIVFYINNSNVLIPPGLGNDFAQKNILNAISNLQMIDYAPIKRNFDLNIAWVILMRQINMIRGIMINLGELNITHIKANLNLAQQGYMWSEITANLPIMMEALCKNRDRLTQVLTILEEFCAVFASIDGKRFHWEKDKKLAEEYCEKIRGNIPL